VRVCVVAEYYPRRRDPSSGVWAHRQALAARDAGADIARVLVLERPLPSAGAGREAVRGRPRRLLAELSEHRAQSRTETLDGIEVEYVPYLSPPRERSYSRWHRFAERPLAHALDRAGPVDLVHAHYALPSGGAARPWARRNRVPMVVSVHGGDVMSPVLGSPPARARVAEVLRDAAGVMCNSRATLRLAAALAGGGANMRVVHLGAEPPPGEPAVPHAEPTVCTLAYLIARKRHADVLEALALLPPEVRWAVIGDGPERAPLEAQAERLGVAGRIDWLGQLPPQEALRELARCHAMAMPSEDEAFGVAYAEALACGVPAIGCAGEGGPEEIAALGEGMILVPPREPETLANAIRDLLADDAERRRLAEAGRRTAAEHLSWEACGRDTVAAYEDALR
jgi:teichuronic acid biosynthesis glycosyltransferase TuaC